MAIMRNKLKKGEEEEERKKEILKEKRQMNQIFPLTAHLVLADEITCVIISNTCMTGQVIYRGNSKRGRISEKWLKNHLSN